MPKIYDKYSGPTVRANYRTVGYGVVVRSIGELLSRCACYVILPVLAGVRRPDRQSEYCQMGALPDRPSRLRPSVASL